MTLAASTFTIASLLLIGAAGCTLHAAQEGTARSSEIDVPRYVAGELIVKLKPEAGEILDGALQAAAPPTHTELPWLDALNRRYGVSAIEPVFAHQPDLDEIKRKYPERSRRAPPDARPPNLKYIYKLTMRHDVDVIQAAADYAKQPDVEYAEPNAIATIQPETAGVR